MTDFTHLHVHSEFSLLDGFCRITDLLDQTAKLGMDTVALTDHGAMYAAADFYLAARERGIRPIIGCEIYVAPRAHTDRDPTLDRRAYHLTLLARNLQGYRNLVRLVSRASLDGFYYKPRVDRELLRAHAAGLICLSGCPSGELSRALAQDDQPQAEAIARWHADVFGSENYYIELQRPGLPEQEPLVHNLIGLASSLGLPVVASNDVHYLTPDDKDAHDILLCIQTGSRVGDTDRMRMEGDWHLKSPEEMAQAFGDQPDALANSMAIAQRCDIELPFGRIAMPEIDLPNGMTATEYLTQKATEGLSRRLPGAAPTYHERLNYELNVIDQTDFSPYLLLVSEIMEFARSQGMLTAPRGSVNGSLVAYATGMSEIDPIKHNIIFERFLSVGRKGSMPDVDMDFPSDRRDEVIEYITRRFGSDHVAQIVTFGTLAARAAVRDSGRVLGMDYGEVDHIAKLIPVNPITPFDINRSLESVSELKDLYQDDARVRRLLDSAQRIEGVARHASTHAAGLVVSKGPLQEHIPLTRSADGQPVAQFTFQTIEKIGLLKLDVLGLSNLQTIQHTLRLVEQDSGHKLMPEDIALDDDAAFALLRKGRTVGVFQLESTGMTRTLRDLAPANIGELAAIIALYRPGPMANIETYIDRKHGRSEPTYLHESLEPILHETYGVLVYADQVLMIARELPGYSWDEADNFRKAIGKKIRHAVQKEHEQFVTRSTNRGIPTDVAEQVFTLIEPFAGYGFNKAHAVSYAVIAYWTAWLKAHHPVEFLSALLATDAGEIEKIARTKAEAELLGVDVLPPNINQSSVTFQPRNRSIVFGLAAVKNVGEPAVEAIVSARESDGSFTSLADACERVDLRCTPKSAWESLIKVGALDELGERQALLESLEPTMKRGRSVQSDRATGQATMFDTGLLAPTEEATFGMADVPAASEIDRRRWEKELLGLYVTPSPLSDHEIGEQLASNVDARIYEIEPMHVGQTLTVGGVVSGVRSFITRKGHTMGAVTLEDPPGTIEVICFPHLWQRIAADLETDRVVMANGRIEGDDVAPRMLADNMYTLSAISDDFAEPNARHSSQPDVDAIQARSVRSTEAQETTEQQTTHNKRDADRFGARTEVVAGNTNESSTTTESLSKPEPVFSYAMDPDPIAHEVIGSPESQIPLVNPDVTDGLPDEEPTADTPPTRVIVTLHRSPDPSFDIDLLKRLEAATSTNRGETPLDLRVVKPDGSVTRLLWHHRVDPSDVLLVDLTNQFGADAVQIS